jgi:phosphoribosylanthranilate isomerase
MFVKICGITNESDALFALAMGADALGFVFAPSPRQVAIGAVAEINRRLPGGTLTVGVFRDSLPERVIEVVTQAGLKGVQLHGSELPEDALRIRPHVHFLIKAFGVNSRLLVRALEYPADALLVDSPRPGSGEVFDWEALRQLPSSDRLILAGGLTAENVGEAIRQVRPFGVDVSSGIESSPGHKDPRKLRAFMQAVREAEQSLTEGSESEPAQDQLQTPLYNWQEEE